MRTGQASRSCASPRRQPRCGPPAGATRASSSGAGRRPDSGSRRASSLLMKALSRCRARRIACSPVPTSVRPRLARCGRRSSLWTRCIPFTACQLTVCPTEPCVASCAFCSRRTPRLWVEQDVPAGRIAKVNLRCLRNSRAWRRSRERATCPTFWTCRPLSSEEVQALEAIVSAHAMLWESLCARHMAQLDNEV
jgi:hypothetical protein